MWLTSICVGQPRGMRTDEMAAGVKCGQTRIQPVSHSPHAAASPGSTGGKAVTEQAPMLALRRARGGCRQRRASSLWISARGRGGHIQAAGRQQ